jgi:molecular chaperone DnaK (HSP70)
MSTEPTAAANRYVVGVDLGTTNSAVAYVDTQRTPWRVETFAVSQLVAAGQVEARETLPSFQYQPASGELPPEALKLPWSQPAPDYAVGFFARDHGAMVPGRLITSAKSWLCHSGVDRTAALLPWQGAADVTRLSPVEASARYLRHIRAAWDARFPHEPLAQQDFVLTLPASFDEVARELTVKAAAQAGLPRVVLIEEPQAAFYAWIYAHTQDWEQLVAAGQKILVCDIGGGTSDFTLIRVRRGESGKVQFHRVAVGEHLILGGDNLDLALARHLEARLTGGGNLDPRQWAVLVRICQRVKEQLLGTDAPERLVINLPGSGSRLIGGGMQLEVTAAEVREILVDGFFPRVDLDARPARRQSGFQEFGLPYAADPGMTRYLASFLRAHRNVALDDVVLPEDADPARPDIVLFNGGLFESPLLRARLLEVICSWFPGRPGELPWQPVVLDNDRLDLAVARGAAYYGMVRRGQGVRIAAGLARTYYIGVESAEPTAVCLVPAGVEPGTDVELTQRTFRLRVSEPVEFPLFVSSTRLTDRPGELLPLDREQLTPLPPIRTVLRTAKKGEAGSVSIHLHARLTEIGTLELWCSQLDTNRTWRLEFDVRAATQTDRTGHESAAEAEGFVDESLWAVCQQRIEETFAPEPAAADPNGLAKRLAQVTGMDRRQWPASLLRRMWDALMQVEQGRRRSQLHEARWLNLLGFALRPGYGLAVDDWRVAETWRLLQGKLIHPTATCRNEWWILWRRIAGGLTAGQQQALADPLLTTVRAMHRQTVSGKGRGGDISFQPHETPEAWRLLGSLELLSVPARVELGNLVIDLLPRRKMEPVRGALAWTLGRVGARVPVYGPLNTVVPAEAVADWIQKLLDVSAGGAMEQLAAMQMARRTGDRYRDLEENPRGKVIDWLRRQSAPAHFIELVQNSGTLDAEEQGLVFGEALPKGLRIE